MECLVPLRHQVIVKPITTFSYLYPGNKRRWNSNHNIKLRIQENLTEKCGLHNGKCFAKAPVCRVLKGPKDKVGAGQIVDGPLPRYAKLRTAHVPGMRGTFSPPPRVSDHDMHHIVCVTHVPWCISRSLTGGFLRRRWLENVSGIAGACTTRQFTYLSKGPGSGSVS